MPESAIHEPGKLEESGGGKAHLAATGCSQLVLVPYNLGRGLLN